MEEPTGMRVRDEAGREVTLTFAAFTDAIERRVILPDDLVCSHIVTGDVWLRVGDLRLYGVLTDGVDGGVGVKGGAAPPILDAR